MDGHTLSDNRPDFPPSRPAGSIGPVIVRFATDGAVVSDADNCARVHLETDLDADGLRTVLAATGAGELIDGDTAWLDLGVLRSRATLVATAPGWSESWAGMVADAERTGRLSDDGRSVQVPVERDQSPTPE